MSQFPKQLVLLAVWILLSSLNGKANAQDAEAWQKIQGEYKGEAEMAGEAVDVGIQLVASGDDQFRCRMLIGGLPGDGLDWDDQPCADIGVMEPATLQDGRLEFKHDGHRIVWEDGICQVWQEEVLLATLERVERESSSLGQEAPEGAVVLFDGSSGEGFTALNEGDPMVDGVLRQGIRSNQEFAGDFDVHIEFQLPFEPAKSGQGRGNSGIYVQGRYEVQMLDSFGLSGEHNECGGIYSVRKPNVNMCYPPGSWQTYDIEFRSAKWDGDTKTESARMTVYHNGVLIHEDVEVPKATTAAPLKESADPGYLFLQDHGSQVRYRNIWVRPRN